MKLIPAALIEQGKNTRVAMAALLAAAAIGGWAISAICMPGAAALDGLSRVDPTRKGDMQSPEELKPNLVGSYVVSGTDPDGRPYAGSSIVDISLAPSGALELEWDKASRSASARSSATSWRSPVRPRAGPRFCS